MSRCHCHARVNSASGGLLSDAAWCLVYDANNAGAYTSVVGCLIAANHMGPYAFSVLGTSGDTGAVAVTPTGYYRKQFKVPNVVLPTGGAPSDVNEVVGNGWFSCSDPSVVVGYLKFAIDSLNSAATYDLFVTYHMEYRMRT